MWRRIGMVVLLLLPAAGRAADAPERLLPSTTQVYMRWDGIEAHREAYDRSALGQTLKGDTGKFVTSVFDQFQNLLSGAVVAELLKGTPPDKLQKIQEDAVRAPRLIGALGKHGLIVAAEVRSIEPPDVQVTLIIPDAADRADSFLATLRLASSLSQQPIKESKIEGRTVFQPAANVPVSVAWWVEGQHIILTGGTTPPETLIKNLDGKGDRLTDSALFRRVAGFKDFETGTRAFVDVAGLAKVAGSGRKEVAKALTDLGLDSVKSVVLYSGFDGPVDHGLMEIDFSGPRRGALALLGAKSFRFEDVPPLPADTPAWTMTNFDAAAVYDEGVRAAEVVLGAVSPDDLPKLKAGLKQLDDILGINLRQDLLAALGDQVVQYTSPTDGPLFFGNTYLIKVKDAARLETSLEQAIKGVAKETGVDVTTKKRDYHGVTLREVHVRQPGFIFLPTYAIYKDWLVLAYYPQPVQAFVLRAKGELPRWEPDDHVRRALAKLPKEFTTISVADPRPTIKQVLALAPLAGAAVESSLPGSTFDAGLIPNGHEATRYLFPNVSVVTADRDTLRLESRSSVGLVLDLGNTDTLAAIELIGIFALRSAK